MHPPVAKREIPVMLAAADLAAVCFVDSAPLHTGSPNKAFDAFAAATPVLMNFAGWLGQRVREYGAGIVAARDDLDASAAQILALLDDPEAHAAARRAARALARDHFARDELAAAFGRVLCEAARADREPVPCPTG